MKTKTIFFVSLLAIFMMLMIPNVSCVESSGDKKISPTDPIVVNVRGGLGIHIDVYGVDESVPINTVVTGAYSNTYTNYYNLQNHLYIHIVTFKFSAGKINLNIYVGNQLWSYEATNTLFIFVKDIMPVE
jgi:hypothetical protein